MKDEVSPNVYNSLEPLWVCLWNQKGCFLLARETSEGSANMCPSPLQKPTAGGPLSDKDSSDQTGANEGQFRQHTNFWDLDSWFLEHSDLNGHICTGREAKPGAAWDTYHYTQRDSIDSWWSIEWILEFSPNLVFFTVSVKNKTKHTTLGIISKDTEAKLAHCDSHLSFPQVTKNLNPISTSGNPPPYQPNGSWKWVPFPLLKALSHRQSLSSAPAWEFRVSRTLPIV